MSNNEDQLMRDWFQKNKQEVPDHGFTLRVHQRIRHEQIPAWYYVVWGISLGIALLLMVNVGLFSSDTWMQLYNHWSKELIRGWGMIATIDLTQTLMLGAFLLLVSMVTIWVVRRE